LHAVGQNRTAAALAGINVTRIVISAFVLSSVLAGMAGTLLGGYFGGASQDMGVSYLMTSVAATVIVGTSASGGKSSVAGAVAGSLLLTLMIILIASVPKGRKLAAA